MLGPRDTRDDAGRNTTNNRQSYAFAKPTRHLGDERADAESANDGYEIGGVGQER